MHDQTTPLPPAQPALFTHFPARPSRALLLAQLDEAARTTIEVFHLDDFKAENMDLLPMIPAARRYGLIRRFPDGTRQIMIECGLSEKEAFARAKELNTKRAAAGFNLWN